MPQEKIETTYWHHPESGCVFELKPGEQIGNGIDAGNCVQLTLPEYKKLKNKYDAIAIQQTKTESKKTEEAVKEIEKEGFHQLIESDDSKKENIKTNILEGVPKSLVDLMLANEVTVEEIQEVVAKKGYFPKNTPIKNYPADFINGCLVGAWDQVFTLIDNERVPF